MSNYKYISIGKILNFHGIHGEAKLGYSKNNASYLSQVCDVFFLQNNEYVNYKVEYLKFTAKCAIIKFKNIDTLNDILQFKGALVFVKEEALREMLEEDEFLIDELVGMEVYDGDQYIGAVVGVSNNGATDLLSIKTKSKTISMIPFVKDIVPEVNIKKKRIQINNIEGLIS